MAELTTRTPEASCCSTEAQSSCCEPSEKDACCATAAAGGSCGCAAGQTVADIRETVRERYAAAAVRATDPVKAAGCCADRFRNSNVFS